MRIEIIREVIKKGGLFPKKKREDYKSIIHPKLVYFLLIYFLIFLKFERKLVNSKMLKIVGPVWPS